MDWRTLLEKLGILDPPVPDLMQAATDSKGRLDRRAFLKLAGATVGGAAIVSQLDIDKLLWAPKTHLLVPDTTIVTAKTMAEAIGQSLVAHWPNGTRADIAIGNNAMDPFKRTLEERVREVIAEVESSGGRVSMQRAYNRHDLAAGIVPEDLVANVVEEDTVNAAVKNIRDGSNQSSIVKAATEQDLRTFTREAIQRNVNTGRRVFNDDFTDHTGSPHRTSRRS